MDTLPLVRFPFNKQQLETHFFFGTDLAHFFCVEHCVYLLVNDEQKQRVFGLL